MLVFVLIILFFKIGKSYIIFTFPCLH